MKKVLTCIASLVPLLGLVGGFLMMIPAIILDEAGNENVGLVLAMFSVVVILVAVLMCWVDIVWFIVIAVKNKKLSDMQKLVWGIVLYMVNVLAFPVFWFMVIRKEE